MKPQKERNQTATGNKNEKPGYLKLDGFVVFLWFMQLIPEDSINKEKIERNEHKLGLDAIITDFANT